MAPHTGSATPEQINALLDFLDEHKDLAHGKLRNIEGKLQAKRLWDELCNMLNSMGGCTKSVQQWQKVWFDRKHLAKKVASDARKAASATGGGPSTAPQLSQWELKVISIMGEGFGERQTGARVPAFNETTEPDEPIPCTSSQGSFSQPLSLDLPDLDSRTTTNEPTQQSDTASQPMSQESVTPRASQRPLRSTRRRRSVSDSNLSSRLLQIEDERKERETVRNTELAGIKVALLQLCELIREYLDK